MVNQKEADRYNDGKPQFSLISFSMFKDVYLYLKHIQHDNTEEKCLISLLDTLTKICESEDEVVYKVLLPKLQALSYYLSLIYKRIPLFDTKLLDLRAFEDMAKVLEYGTEKYSRDNWKKGYDNKFSTADSLYRHARQLIIGETHDEESGLHHIGHIMCNVMFLTNDLLYVNR